MEERSYPFSYSSQTTKRWQLVIHCLFPPKYQYRFFSIKNGVRPLVVFNFR